MRFKHLRSVIVVLSVAAMLAFGRGANAEDPNAILDLLEHKGIITHEEAEQARKYYDKQMKDAVVKNDKTKVSSWIDEMKWSGDLRLRAENLEYEKNPATGALVQSARLRYRIRARLGLDMKLQDWADLGFQIGTGDSGDPLNSVSQNSTLTDAFRKKPINLNLAYVTVHPPPVDWLSVTAGKMPLPMWHPVTLSPMIYDPDVTPEGLVEKLSFKFGNKQQYRLFGNFGQFAVEEFSKDANDVYMFDMQGGLEAKFDRVKVTVGGGYYLTHDLQLLQASPSPGTGAPAGTLPGDIKTGISANTGNSASIGSTTNYLGNFAVLYGGGEVAWTIADQPFLGTPSVLTLGGEYLDNLASVYRNVSASNPDNQTQGWALQAVFGKADKKGQWLIGYEYKDLEANATWDAIVDDDFGTFGGTDRKGHVVNAVYCVKDWWQLGFKAFITDKIDAKRTGAHAQGGFAGQDSLRFQADTMFKF